MVGVVVFITQYCVQQKWEIMLYLDRWKLMFFIIKKKKIFLLNPNKVSTN